MDAITTLISTLGFPIACCVAMGFFIWKMVERLMMKSEEDMVKLQANCKEREEKLFEEIKVNRETNAQFVAVIAKYDIKLDAMQHDITDIKNKIK